MAKAAFFAILLLAAAGLYLIVTQNQGGKRQQVVEATIPALSARATEGQAVFNRACATCHGRNALGGAAGPPLIHKIYEPSHHGDAAFQAAVRVGVRQHHWSFGSMPPQPGVTEAQTAAIITFVREVQRANGID